MDISELIGFLISFLAFVFLFFRRTMKNKNEDETREEQEKGQKLKDFLRSLDIEMREDDEENKRPIRPLPPPKRVIKHPPKKPVETYRSDTRADTRVDTYKHQTALETRNLQTQIQARLDEKSPQYKEAVNDYHMIQKEKPSRGLKIFKALRSPKDMIVLNEILRRPYG